MSRPKRYTELLVPWMGKPATIIHMQNIHKTCRFCGADFTTPARNRKPICDICKRSGKK